MLRILVLAILLPTMLFMSTVNASTLLKAVEVPLTVDGRQAKVFDIIQADGTQGFYGVKGQ